MRVFFDANVLFSACNSGSNISRLLDWVVEDHTAVTSDLAIEEARKNLAHKRRAWLSALGPLLLSVEVAPSVLFELPTTLAQKDASLLCTAIRSRCDLFVTGDRRGFGHLYGKKIRGVEVVSVLRLAEILRS